MVSLARALCEINERDAPVTISNCNSFPSAVMTSQATEKQERQHEAGFQKSQQAVTLRKTNIEPFT